MADEDKYKEAAEDDMEDSGNGRASEEAVTDLRNIAQELSDEAERLRNDLDELQAKSQEYLDGWQRERAEFANFKRRVERERDQVYQQAAGSVIRRYLEVADDLERALKNRPEDGEGALWAEGIDLIYRKLLAGLEAEGVQQMEAEDQLFDPNLHEAISHEPSPDTESGYVIEVVKSGYMLGDRVLRPATVRVAR